MWSLLALALISSRVVAYIQSPYDVSPRASLPISESKLSASPSPNLRVKSQKKSTTSPTPRVLPTPAEKISDTVNPEQRKQHTGQTIKLIPTEFTKTLDRCTSDNCLTPTPKPTISINPIKILPSPTETRPTPQPKPEVTVMPDPSQHPKPSECPPAPLPLNKAETDRFVFEDPIYCLD